MNVSFWKRNGIHGNAGRIGCTLRTASKYADHPELIGKPGKAPLPRGSKLDAYLPHIRMQPDDDPFNRESAICDKLPPPGYTGSCELVKIAVRATRNQERQPLCAFETEPGADSIARMGGAYLRDAPAFTAA